MFESIYMAAICRMHYDKPVTVFFILISDMIMIRFLRLHHYNDIGFTSRMGVHTQMLINILFLGLLRWSVIKW